MRKERAMLAVVLSFCFLSVGLGIFAVAQSTLWVCIAAGSSLIGILGLWLNMFYYPGHPEILKRWEGRSQGLQGWSRGLEKTKDGKKVLYARLPPVNRLIRRYPRLILAYLPALFGSMVSVVVFLNALDGGAFYSESGWPILIGLYALSFACCSFQSLGFFASAELLQRKLLNKPRNFFWDMIINFVFAIPFIAIQALLWVIMILALLRDEDDDEKIPRIEKFTFNMIQTVFVAGLYAFIVGFQCFMAFNMAGIAMHEKRRYSLREATARLRKEGKGIALGLFTSEIILVYLALACYLFPVIAWLYRFGLGELGAMIGFLAVALLWQWSIMVEHLSLLLLYLREEAPETVKDFVNYSGTVWD